MCVCDEWMNMRSLNEYALGLVVNHLIQIAQISTDLIVHCLLSHSNFISQMKVAMIYEFRYVVVVVGQQSFSMFYFLCSGCRIRYVDEFLNSHFNSKIYLSFISLINFSNKWHSHIISFSPCFDSIVSLFFIFLFLFILTSTEQNATLFVCQIWNCVAVWNYMDGDRFQLFF